MNISACPPPPVNNTMTLQAFSCRVNSQLLVGITGLGTLTAYQELLRGLLYHNIGDEPNKEEVNKTVTVSIVK